jgi:hypothetical protein
MGRGGRTSDGYDIRELFRGCEADNPDACANCNGAGIDPTVLEGIGALVTDADYPKPPEQATWSPQLLEGGEHNEF